MIFKYRIVLDTLDDVIRDIEIRDQATLEDLHNAISQAFGFDGTEMASFYKSDEEWNQGEEFLLFDMSEGEESVKMMNETSLDEVFSKSIKCLQKLILCLTFITLQGMIKYRFD